MDEKVSIIVPVFNVERYLPRCVNSLLCQTYPNIEILLIDDGSNDSSGQICDCYANRIDNIKTIHLSNSGVSFARNLGIKNSDGKYISFVDADDWVDPDYISKMVKAMLIDNADMVMCGWYERKNTYEFKSKICSGESALLEISVPTGGHYLAIWNKLFKREYIKLFHNDISYLEDGLFIYEYISDFMRVSFIPDKLYHYEINENSITHNFKPSRERLSSIKAREMMIALTKDNSVLKNLAKAKYQETVRCVLFQSYRYGYKEDVRKYIPLLKKYTWNYIFCKYIPLKTKARYTLYKCIIIYDLGEDWAEYCNGGILTKIKNKMRKLFKGKR